MMQYFCGLFDYYTKDLILAETITGVTNTRDVMSRFISNHRDTDIITNDKYYLCITTEHKSNVVVFLMTAIRNSNGKTVISGVQAKDLDKETVDVLVSRTLQSPE